MMTAKINKIKKLDNGKLAVQYKGDKKFYVIQDDIIGQYLIYLIVHTKDEVLQNQNSMCR